MTKELREHAAAADRLLNRAAVVILTAALSGLAGMAWLAYAVVTTGKTPPGPYAGFVLTGWLLLLYWVATRLQRRAAMHRARVHELMGQLLADEASKLPR